MLWKLFTDRTAPLTAAGMSLGINVIMGVPLWATMAMGLTMLIIHASKS